MLSGSLDCVLFGTTVFVSVVLDSVFLEAFTDEVTLARRLSSCRNPQRLIPISSPITIKPMALLMKEGRTIAMRTGFGAGAADRRRMTL